MQQYTYTHPYALILGGSSGLGLASAQELAREGWPLLIVHRDRKSTRPAIRAVFTELAQIAPDFHAFNVDALRADQRAALLQHIAEILGSENRIGLLLHSIAKGNLKPMTGDQGPHLQHDDFQLTLAAMATSLYDWVYELHTAQLFSPHACVLSFTSEGNQKAWPYYGAVAAAKAALEAITRQIALEFAPYGIRANCIQAGTTDTPSLRMIPGHEQLIDLSIQRNPYGRLTRAEDVARVVSLLARPEAAWINGSIIPVDGGEHLR
ncbi:MAG: SDR family oxidoreductase [Bacteroidetes bacterium]|nr:MAG: SDR family oxidoreductase [Bacteroidota bacterium]